MYTNEVETKEKEKLQHPFASCSVEFYTTLNLLGITDQ